MYPKKKLRQPFWRKTEFSVISSRDPVQGAWNIDESGSLVEWGKGQLPSMLQSCSGRLGSQQSPDYDNK
jgi:hypothetical protein